MKCINDVPISEVTVGPNSRGPLKDAELGRLVTSIENQGMLQPVGVYQKDKGGKYTLIYGNRRFKAAKILGWKKIPAVFHERMDLAEGQDLLQNASENWVRTNPSFTEQAKLFDRLLKMGLTGAAIVERTGITKTLFEKVMRAHKILPSHIQKNISTNRAPGKQKTGSKKIPIHVADTLVTLTQRKKLTKSQIDKVYKHMLEHQPSADDLSTMESLMDKGVPLDKAIATSKRVKVMWVKVKVDQQKLERLANSKGFKSPLEYCVSILRRSKGFPIVDL